METRRREIKQIGAVKIEAAFWGPEDHRTPPARIYFTEVGRARNAGKLIWDCETQNWIHCHQEMGWRIKELVKRAWNL